MPYNVVLDTNVVIAAMRSRRGASFRLLSLLGDPRFNVAISAPLVFEYESVAFRPEVGVPLTRDAIIAILDRICDFGRKTTIFFHWRPYLRDAGDELSSNLQWLRGVGTSSRTTYETSRARSSSASRRFHPRHSFA